MSVTKSEFFLALNQVATERGISPDEVIESIKTAVLAAYKKDYHLQETGDEENIKILINKDTGETKIFVDEKETTPPGFGRIAAQTARQVILQKIREAEKKMIIRHYLSQVGTLIKGRVIKFDGQNAYFDIGKTEALLPFEEQMKNENYKLNTAYLLLVKEIKEDKFGNFRIIVSRADPRLVSELFKKEVPEVEQGTVKIKKVVRSPGERAKIAVYSDQRGVDPVGACVGQKGIRVKAVTETLGGEEKIDIIQYHQDDGLFIREALSPTKVETVEIDKEKKHARVFVNQEQAPLAIGKKGVNVDLASKLTEYEIDIIQITKTQTPEDQQSTISKEKITSKADSASGAE